MRTAIHLRGLLHSSGMICVRRSVGVVAIAVCILSFRTMASAQTAISQQREAIRVEGAVRNVAGVPLPGVIVQLRGIGAAQFSAAAKTGADGSFVVIANEPGTYTVSAEKPGWRSANIPALVLSKGEKKRLDLVLENSEADHPAVSANTSSKAMTLRDEPNFVVAGVTDGTNMGGHGSDSVRRTSDSLAKDTVALKTPSPATSVADKKSGTPEDESKLRAALLGNPSSYEANQQLGDFYLRSQRYREAIPLLEAAYRMHPDDFTSAYNLALAYQSNGELTRAREQVRQMLTRTQKPELHRLLGDLDEQLDDPLGAVYEYEQAARLDPSEQNYFNWGTELLLHRAPQAAIEVFAKGAAAYSHSGRLLAGLAAALYANGSYDEAATRLCAASDLNPKDPAPYIFLGKMAKAASAPLTCAEEKLARFAHEQPGNALANYYYAMALWKKGRGSQAAADLHSVKQLLNETVRIDPKFAEAYLQLGIIAADQGETPQAIGALKQAIGANQQLAEAHYRLGLAYKQNGEATKAQQEFQSYEQLSKEESALVERQRRELRQYVITLKDQQSAVR
jgi:tetratricopeptide (TPR) repeat protein